MLLIFQFFWEQYKKYGEHYYVKNYMGFLFKQRGMANAVMRNFFLATTMHFILIVAYTAVMCWMESN